MLVLCSAIAMAPQKRTVTGSVRDADGTPIVQASVLIKGSPQGVATDANGRFSINVEGAKPVLVISFVGFHSQEIEVGAQASIDVVLQNANPVDDGSMSVFAMGFGKRYINSEAKHGRVIEQEAMLELLLLE